MADVNEVYWFPSQTGYYNTKAGEIRFKLYYSESDVNNNNISAEVKEISRLNIPLEVDASQNTFRGSSLSITFLYNSAIETMLDHLRINSKQNKTFLKIYLNGSEVWRGLLNWEMIKRTGYYIDSGSLCYRYITLAFDDALAYFWRNNQTLNNASYSDGQKLETLLQNIFALIGFASTDVYLDTNIGISEDNGASYDITDFKILGLSSDQYIIDFLKDIMLGFGAFIYNLNGKVYVVKRTEGDIISISNDDVLKYDKNRNTDKIDYIAVTATIDTANLDTETSLGSLEFTESIGTQSSKSMYNKEYTSNLLGKLYVSGDGSEYSPGDQLPSGGGSNYLDDSEASFLVSGIETGDIVYYNYNSVTGLYEEAGMIVDGITATRIYFKNDAGSNPVDQWKEYKVNKGDEDYPEYKRFKTELLLKGLVDCLNEYYNTGEYVNDVVLKNVGTYKDIHSRFSLFSQNYRIKSANIDLVKDNIHLSLLEVI